MDTEDRLIYANDFLDLFYVASAGQDKSFIKTVEMVLEDTPSVEVKHGRWIQHNKGQNNWVECSECNTVGSPFWKRCPICEAKMEVDLNGV